MYSSDFNAAKTSQNVDAPHLFTLRPRHDTKPINIIGNTDMKLHVPARDGHRAIHKLIVAGMRAVSARNSARHSDWLGIYDSGCRTYSSHAEPDEHHQSIRSSMSPTQRLSRLTSTNLVGHRNLDPRPSRQQHTDARQLCQQR